MECSYCNAVWDDNIGKEFCPNCGKSATKVVSSFDQSVITNRQIIGTIIAGLLSYIVILFIFQRIALPFTFEFYFGIDLAFVMGYRVLYLFFKTSDYNIRDFFPHYQEFFILIWIVIWFVYFLLTTLFNRNFNTNSIDFVLIGTSFTNFAVGYIIGITLIAYFYFRTIKRHRKRIARQMINTGS